MITIIFKIMMQRKVQSENSGLGKKNIFFWKIEWASEQNAGKMARR